MARRAYIRMVGICQGRKLFRPWFVIVIAILVAAGGLGIEGHLISGTISQHQVVFAQESPGLGQDVDLADVPAPSVPPSARLGHPLYQENCAPCHGATGMGDGPAVPDLPALPTAFADLDVMWDKSPVELFYVTKFGRIENLMPPWGNRLSDGQIWQVVAYSWSLHTTQNAVDTATEQYAASCADCHGAQGAGDGPQASVDMPNFSDLGYAMAQSQAAWMAGWMEAHPDVGATWSQSEQRDVLEYVRTFSYAPPWQSGYRPGDGVIQGQVIQGTPDGPDVGDAVVHLEAYANFEPLASFTTTVQADGSFEFADLAMDETLFYLASTSHADIRYTSPLITLSAAEPAIPTEVVVYEPTTDATGIQLDRTHWIVDFQPGAALIGQIFSFGSTADRAYVGQLVEGIDAPVTVAMMIPPGAQELAFESGMLGERFQRVDNLVYDTTPVIPGTGTKQIVLRFILPYADDSISMVQEFMYPVGQLDLLVAELPDAQATVNGLTSVGSQAFQGRSYQIWQGSGLSPGIIEMELSGLLRSGEADPRATGAVDATTGQAAVTAASVSVLEPWMAWVSGALIVVVMAGVFGWAWTQGRIKTADHQEALVVQRDQLMGQIARLDDLYAAGEIDADDWQNRRARLKAELLDIAIRLSDSASVI